MRALFGSFFLLNFGITVDLIRIQVFTVFVNSMNYWLTYEFFEMCMKMIYQYAYKEKKSTTEKMDTYIVKN